jgi:hypothetical protein
VRKCCVCGEPTRDAHIVGRTKRGYFKWAHPACQPLHDDAADPFPLLEETREGVGLPTVSEWLRAGAPMREVRP